MRVAQGSPGIAGTSLSEQVLLVTFGETKVTEKIASSLESKSPKLHTVKKPNKNRQPGLPVIRVAAVAAIQLRSSSQELIAGVTCFCALPLT